ncbi:MAG: AraC family transcriptional regulator [Blastocatellia bacterium]
MQPIFLKVTPAAQASFDIRREVAPQFGNPWHFHPEYELTQVLRSAGVRFVGDSIERFAAGDLVLIGPNLPHYWRNDPHRAPEPSQAEAIILRFSDTCLGNGFFDLPEMQDVQGLLRRAARGIKFGGNAATQLEHLLGLNGFHRAIAFLTLLHDLANEADYQLLTTPAFSLAPDPSESERINKVYAYVMERYTQPLRLEEVAAVANMNPTAFCRYFLQRTGKTLIGLVNEIRVGYACKLLSAGELNVTEICYACGFQNLSHFNRCFKKITCLTPTEYRRQHQAARE